MLHLQRRSPTDIANEEGDVVDLIPRRIRASQRVSGAMMREFTAVRPPQVSPSTDSTSGYEEIGLTQNLLGAFQRLLPGTSASDSARALAEGVTPPVLAAYLETGIVTNLTEVRQATRQGLSPQAIVNYCAALPDATLSDLLVIFAAGVSPKAVADRALAEDLPIQAALLHVIYENQSAASTAQRK